MLDISATSITLKVGPMYQQLYLVSYYGEGVNIVDSLMLKDGEAEWKSDQQLPQGIYFLTDAHGSSRVDFLLGDDQDLTIAFSDLSSSKFEISGSEESMSFLDYQRYVSDVSRSKEEKLAYTRNALHLAAKGSMLSLVLSAMLPPEAGGASPLLLNDAAQRDYVMLHFWDNYDLTDKRIVRTPFFAKTVDYYLRHVLPAREDLIIKAMLPLLEISEAEVEVLKIVANAALQFAVEEKIMGLDALAYEVINRYYLNGNFGELPQKQEQMLMDYVKHTKHCRVGNIAKDIQLPSWNKELGDVSLHNTDAAYTLLLFWEPDCEYCKFVVPALVEGVCAKYHDKGLHVFAVNTQDNYDLWSEYIFDHKLFEWTHVYDKDHSATFMIDYGVRGTPYMYILDKDKRIVAKNVKLDFLDVMLERLFATGEIY